MDHRIDPGLLEHLESEIVYGIVFDKLSLCHTPQFHLGPFFFLEVLKENVGVPKDQGNDEKGYQKPTVVLVFFNESQHLFKRLDTTKILEIKERDSAGMGTKLFLNLFYIK
jgi:hypothetical protein